MVDVAPVVRCSVPGYHIGYTRNTDGLCIEHRATPENDVSGYVRDIGGYLKALDDLSSVFGKGTEPENYTSRYSFIWEQVEDLLVEAARSSAYRQFPTFDIADDALRVKKAIELREHILASLTPYVSRDKDAALAAWEDAGDKWGRNLPATTELLSFAFTLMWDCNYFLNNDYVHGSSWFCDVEDYVEKTANNFLTSYTYKEYEQLLYVNSNVIQIATGREAVNKKRFPDSLIKAPKQYEAAEAAYQAQKVSEAEQVSTQQRAIAVEAERQELAAANRAAQVAALKTAGAVASFGFGLLGKVANVAVNGTQKSQAQVRAAQNKQRNAQDEEYRRNVQYNAEVQARRNRRSKDGY